MDLKPVNSIPKVEYYTIAAHSFRYASYSACYLYMFHPTCQIASHGNLTIIATYMYSSRRIIVLRPSIVSNQPNDHLMIVQRKKQMDTQIKEHLVRTSVIGPAPNLQVVLGTRR